MIDELKYRPFTMRLVPDPVLREKAVPVKSFTADLEDFANDMFEFMIRNNGIGLAAPQVGVLQRIVVAGTSKHPVCLINPELEKGSGNDEMIEGCLSLPGVEVEISRHHKVSCKARDLAGKELKFKERGLMARVLQHEIDHLNGILISDHGLPVTDDRLRIV